MYSFFILILYVLYINFLFSNNSYTLIIKYSYLIYILVLPQKKRGIVIIKHVEIITTNASNI